MIEHDELSWLRAEVDRLRDQLILERPVPLVQGLRAPFPFFGSKRIAAPLIWEALGNPGNLVIPFAGSLSELWARPEAGKVETVNDASGLIANVWRAIRDDPDAVALHADDIVSEVDLSAWHRTLVAAAEGLKAKLIADPRYFDAELAGRWIWGASCWLGSGWCDGTLPQKRPAIGGQGGEGRVHQGVGVHGALHQTRPHLSNAGVGTHLPRLIGSAGASPQLGVGVNSQLPHLSGGAGTGVGYGRGVHHGDGRRTEGLLVWMRQLAERLRLVRIVCGDFERVVTPAVTISHGVTGIIWDPPYSPTLRAGRIYDGEDAPGTPHEDTVAQRAARRARELEEAHGASLRQVFAGYEGEHEFPGWRCIPWKTRGGYGNQAHGRGRENSERERLWLSPNCLSTPKPTQGSLL